ncbi:helix-turn-helix domain-containing protein [Hydrogenophaga aquatica]
MPATTPPTTELAAQQLQALGALIRAERKALRVSSTATAEAAGVSRVTLHRIEKGEASVAVGAWTNVLAALGLKLTALPAKAADAAAHNPPAGEWIPLHIRLNDYPQLKALAWQVHGTDTLTPAEALDIYERNARHLEVDAMPAHEQALLAALRTAFTKHHV